MKAIIYLRTSTKDQNPELQRKDCIEFCSKRGLEVVEVVSEQGSAYKLEKVRPKWDAMLKRAKKEKLDIVLWKYDRAFRNRVEFFKFMKVMFEVYGTKVLSVTEPSILSFWELIAQSHSDNPVFNELLNSIFKAMWDFMIQQAGEQAEEESRKKSDRVKLAVRKNNNNKTISYKGNKWGRKSISTQARNKVLELKRLNPEMSLREISQRVTYAGKNNETKNLSLGAVHKIINEKQANLSVEKIDGRGSHKLTN